MSVSYIKQETKFILWGKSAGRCQYEGCNNPLYFDILTKAEFNSSYIAHIIADKPNGPRGDKVLSEKYKSDISNLMLLCDDHHRLIDKKEVEEHPIKRLKKMKKDHEDRIFMLSGISKEKESHVILYGANIGEHNSFLGYKQAYQAMIPQYYPTLNGDIRLGLINSSLEDDSKEYWDFETKNLIQKFQQKVVPLTESDNIQNYSIFGLAPQPLLIKLGSLLFDIVNVEVYNPQKEPKTWKWKKGNGEANFFKLIKPQKNQKQIALVFSLSGTVNDDRITSVLGYDCSIWKITIEKPNNDFMKYKNHLEQFRKISRNVLDLIKKEHGEKAKINIFPAMLPSTAIEFGRVWNPKADLPLTIYDQNRKHGGFIKTIEINTNKNK